MTNNINIYYTPASVSTDGKLAGIDLYFELANKDFIIRVAMNKETVKELKNTLEEVLKKEWINY